MKRELSLSLSAAMAVLTGISAQARFQVGPVPYTMQNFSFVLAGLLLEPRYALLSQLLYLALVALGLPFASGLRGGLAVLFGYTAGYLWGFPIAAYLVSLLSRAYLRGKSLSRASRRDMAVLWLISVIAAIPMYVMGFAVFYAYASPGSPLFSWASRTAGLLGLGSSPSLALFAASVLVFLPEDVLLDHVLALAAARVAWSLLEARGAV